MNNLNSILENKQYLTSGPMRKALKNYYNNNKENILNTRKEYYIQNKDNILNSRKEYYMQNKNNILNKCNEYYTQNKEDINNGRKMKCINDPSFHEILKQQKRNSYYKNKLWHQTINELYAIQI